MEQLTFKYLYPVNKENYIDIRVHPTIGDLQIAIRTNRGAWVNYSLHHPPEYCTSHSSNGLKIAHQVIDVLNSIKRHVRKEEVKSANSWGFTNKDYGKALRSLGSKAANFQKHNKNHILSNILVNTFFTFNLLKTMKFYLMREEYGPLVIGIHGTKGAGKTTLAKAIIEGINNVPATTYRGSLYHFADPLKEATSALLGVPIKALEHLKNKDTCIQGSSLTYRQFLQTLGTEFMQSVNKDWAIELTEKYIEEVREHIDVVVIPDIRFEHEARFIKEQYNGILIKLNREGYTVKDDHASEQAIDCSVFDTIINVTTKNDSLVVANTIINTYT